VAVALIVVGAISGASGAQAGADVVVPRLFWVKNDSPRSPGAIGTAKRDGSDVNRRLVGSGGFTLDLAASSRHIYWINDVVGLDYSQAIARAGVDGTEVNARFVVAPSIGGIAVDAQHIYWTSVASGEIARADLDGAHINRHFIVGASYPVGLAVDGQHIYWTNRADTPSIARANLDGSAVNERFLAVNAARLAVAGGHIYWNNGYGTAIGRADLDGSNVVEPFINPPDASGAWGIAADSEHLYWTTGGFGTIARANLDGSGVNSRFIVGGSFTGAVAWSDALRTPVQYRALLRAQLTPPGNQASIVAVARRSGYTYFIKQLDPGRLTLRWYSSAKRGASRHLGRVTRATVAVGSARVGASGTARIHLKLTRAGKRILDHSGRVVVTAHATYTPAGSSEVVATRRFRLNQ
jgi:hypothetical protein